MTLKRADALRIGDTYSSHGTTVTILRDKEPCEDRFGRAMFRYWAKRADTNAEGWVMFGPNGVVHES